MMRGHDFGSGGALASTSDLRETLCLLQATLNATSEGVVVLNEDGSVADFNPEFASMWALPDALLGCRDERLVDWIVDQLVEPDGFRARLLAEEEEPQTLRLRDGRLVEYEATRRSIGDREVARVCRFRDVTEKRRSEQALRDSEERYRVLFEHNPQPILVFEQGGGRVLAANAAAEHCYGYSREEFACLTLADLAPGDGRHLRKDGSVFDVEVREHLITFEGRAARLAAVADVTERKRSEDALRLQALIFDNINDAVVVTDLQGRIIDWSPAAERLYGYAKAEVLGRTFEFLAPAGTAVDPSVLWDAVLQHGRWSGRLAFVRKDGSSGLNEATLLPLRNDRGTVVAAFAVARDVTERHRAEEGLRASEERLRIASCATDDVIWDWDPATDRLWWGEALKTRFGYADQAIEPGSVAWRSRIHPEDCPRVLHSIQTVVHGMEHAWRDEYRFRRADGSYAHVLDRAYVLRDAEGHAVRVIGAMADLSETRQLEDQLRQAQKMEALGRLAGGIAHDFNNLLTAIMGYSDLALRRLAEDHPATRNVSEIRKAGERATLLTHRLLSFSRKQPQQAKILDLNHVVRDTEQMLRRLIGEDIELVTELLPDLRRVKADPGQLEQVLVNLAVNARDAMSGGGRLRVRTANLEVDDLVRRLYPGVVAGEYVMLYVCDTGCGMDEDVRRQAFEPFFTTKRKGEGTGLGLSTVYGIVKQCGGAVRVESEPGRGAAFTILLPCAQGPTEARSGATTPATPLVRGTETVLVVEDDEALRRVAREILETSGYRVVEAGTGEEAVRLLESGAGPIHLLLTDIIMPGMTGRELARRIGRFSPGMKILFMSGYPDDALAERGVRGSAAAFLAKPFTPQILSAKVREVLQVPPPARR